MKGINDHLDNELGENITDGLTGEEKMILFSQEGPDNDIRNSLFINEAGQAENITRYGSNKADDLEE